MLRTGTMEILLVEDNPGDIRLTKEAFKEGTIPNRLNAVTDGVQAIKYLRNIDEFASVTRPDLILLDLNLPKKDGREVLKEIKTDPKLRRIPVIILTTSSSEYDISKAYELHANCYITKPIDFDQFIDVIKMVEEFWLKLVKLPSAN